MASHAGQHILFVAVCALRYVLGILVGVVNARGSGGQDFKTRSWKSACHRRVTLKMNPTPTPTPTKSPSPTDSMSSGEDLGQFDFSAAAEETKQTNPNPEELAEEKSNVPEETPSSATKPGEVTEEKTSSAAKTPTSAAKTPSPVFVPATKTSSKSSGFDLLYWNDPKQSAVVFVGGIFFFYMFMYRQHTVLSLAATAIAFNLIVNGLHTLLKKSPLFPYCKQYVPLKLPTVLDAVAGVTSLALTIAVKQTCYQSVGFVRQRVTKALNECSSIAEFGQMFALTFLVYKIGSWFSPLSLCCITFVGMFSCPKAYQLFQTPIDAKLNELTTVLGSKYTELVQSNEKLEKVINFVTNAPDTKKDL